jgi:hypothetical protein
MITIKSKEELLELIERPNVSHKTASKIVTQYLKVIDVTQSKERLINEIKEMIEIDSNPNGRQQSILLGNPLREL